MNEFTNTFWHFVNLILTAVLLAVALNVLLYYYIFICVMATTNTIIESGI